MHPNLMGFSQAAPAILAPQPAIGMNKISAVTLEELYSRSVRQIPPFVFAIHLLPGPGPLSKPERSSFLTGHLEGASFSLRILTYDLPPPPTRS